MHMFQDRKWLPILLTLTVASCGGDGGEPGLMDRISEVSEAAGEVGRVAGSAGEMRQLMEEMEAEQEEGVTIEPVDFRELRALLPETLPGMDRTNAAGEKTGAMGVTVSNATAEYHAQDPADPATIYVTITDLGGVQPMMLMGYAAWTMTEMDRESDTGFERTREYEGHPAYEKFEREEGETGDGELQALVERRFIVNVRGLNVPMDRIHETVARIDLDRLEQMKEMGVTRGG